MADYDFRSLSSYDFALLARDLLQASLGKRLESFSQGPDSGIDFRYKDERTNLIIQSKHYAESGFAALTSILRRKERAKVDLLTPAATFSRRPSLLPRTERMKFSKFSNPTALDRLIFMAEKI